MENNLEIATFGAGCFWGVEETFRKLPGVSETIAGYSGGEKPNPTYEEVSAGNTGHAESVQITFDPKEISYEELLKVFWVNHNPTTPNRQGPDFGHQYRSVIFYHNEEQKAAAMKSKDELEKSRHWGRPIVTEIVPAKPFYAAEEYHQKYLMKTGRKVC